ncbi:MAG: hypothetical protein A3F72_09235 [Bacteroidetes bacterium RIFCSPLOWO2_12_FULL_35_15]|nr:MAG: hypothetical protein A3F72_09235 [Bacteroidetes bacterium RIFCSPLOWO2_12_FULL_35_15]
MKHFYFRIFLIISTVFFNQSIVFAQLCDSIVPEFPIDFTGHPDTTWTIANIVRDGLCCAATNPNRCVEFTITMDVNQQGIALNSSGGPALGAGGIQLECDTTIYSFLDTICLSGIGPHHVTLCKPGGNAYDYYITSIPKPGAGPPIAVSDGCTGIIYANGYVQSTLVWTSVSPGIPGAYNTYLSCTNGCDTTIVTAQLGYPDSVLYQVTGTPIGGCNSSTVTDSVWVFFVTEKTATILPVNPVVCAGATNSILTATSNGGYPPYVYLWSTGETSQTIAVGVGSYWVKISDQTNCPPVFDTVIVNASPKPVADFSYMPACLNTPVMFFDSSTVSAGTINGWNWNFGDGNTSTLQNPSHPYNAGGTYTVTLISSSADGCQDTVVHTESIQAAPIANAGNDTVSCSNNPTVDLTGTVVNAGGGMWSGSGVFNPNNFVLNTTYTASAAAVANGADTLLLITTSNALCPADTDQVIISFYAGPTVNAGTDIVACKDTTSIPICAAITVASGGIWQTTGTGTFVDSLLTCTQYVPSSADTAAGSVILYNYTTGNGNCLSSSDSVTITFTPLHVIDVKVIDSICAGTPIPLFASSTTNAGIWASSGSGNFLPNNTTLPNSFYNPSAADNASGIISLFFTTTNNTGCKAKKDTSTVILIPAPTPLFTSVSACPFANVVFTDASVSIGQIITWNWNFGDATTSPIQNPTHIYAAGGPYPVSLIVTSINGCVDTTLQILNVYDKPNADFSADGICLGSGTSFLDSSTVNGASIFSWNWNFGDATTGVNQNQIHVYAAGGTYLTTLIVQSTQGCIDTVSQTVNVLPGPVAGFSSDDYSAVLFQNVHFTDQSNGAVSWVWNFGDSSDDSTSTVQNPTHVYNKGGFYDVCLYVTDASGCTDTVCRTEIVSSPPTVPSGFSPNGDGQNDVFYVYGGPFKKLSFRIYNNWGELIFESDDQAKGWDGKRNGIDQAIGVYVYTVAGITQDDEEHNLSGDVTLLR